MFASLATGAGWRRVLIYTHRWLGIVGSLVFLTWFVSGVVMMYARMPRLSAEERLVRLPPLDLSAVRVPLTVAARRAGLVPDRVRLGMLRGRPVYRLIDGEAWKTVYADTGSPLTSLSADAAIGIVRTFMPEHATTAVHAGRIVRPDQWTLDGGLPAFLPMHRIALGDADGTMVYVSEVSGEPVMKTTARGRAWGYAGAVLHWTYIAPLRERRELWRYGIIYTALAGCVMCLSGLIVGLWRFSPSQRFRLRRVPSHSPYAGWMWWHHYAGLLFGLVSFTWALSGALSLTPWDWAPSTSPSAAQTDATSGGPLRLELATPEAIRRAVASIGRVFVPKEIEIRQFQGHPFATAYRPPTWADASSWTNPDVRAMRLPALAIDHRAVWLDGYAAGPFDAFDRSAVRAVAAAAMPGVPVRDAAWLDHVDAYYYDRWTAKPLPVLRVRFADPDATWLYVDARHGLIAQSLTRTARLNRWLYNGLHSFDLPFLYVRRPLWDIVVLVLSAGGIALTITTMLPAWRRLRRHLGRA